MWAPIQVAESEWLLFGGGGTQGNIARPAIAKMAPPIEKIAHKFSTHVTPELRKAS